VVGKTEWYSVKDTTRGLNLFRKALIVSPVRRVSTTKQNMLLEFPFFELNGIFAVPARRTSVKILCIKSPTLVTRSMRPLLFKESSWPYSLYRIS
jgi:hypothetical protein